MPSELMPARMPLSTIMRNGGPLLVAAARDVAPAADQAEPPPIAFQPVDVPP